MVIKLEDVSDTNFLMADNGAREPSCEIDKRQKGILEKLSRKQAAELLKKLKKQEGDTSFG
jgi:hypothetical protein